MTNIKLVSNILSHAIKKKGLIAQSDSAVIFYDLSLIQQKISELKKYFPTTALHASALKANTLFSILQFIRGFGIGTEAASLPEVYLAQKAGFTSNKIFFDSPIKTKEELINSL